MAVYVMVLPFAVVSEKAYADPSVKICVPVPVKVTVSVSVCPFGTAKVPVAVKPLFPSMVIAGFMFTVLAPLLETVRTACVLSVNDTFVTFAFSAFPINPMVIPPIHAATTTLTATVTAMSMIDAITGLRAFALFFIFLIFLM